MQFRGMGRGALLAAAAMGALCYTQMAAAQETRQQYDIEAVDLGEALKAISRQSGLEVIVSSSAVAGKKVRPVHGTFTAQQAIDRLLTGTGLVAELRDGGFVVRGRSSAASASVDASLHSADIVVTGSHIRGGEPTSPVISFTQKEIRQYGYTNLADLVRSIPQNFTGGQNPGVAGGGNQGNQENTTSSTALNLRGLGSDATLTLLNGHRMPYDGLNQGIDISSIPLAAVDRIEIVADGSSAIYGSDAVGGVANVLLKNDFDGAVASARYGGATNGGFEQQQYDIVLGQKLAHTSIIGAATYSKSTAILAGQRSFTSALDGSQTLYPSLEQFSALVNLRHDITDSIRISGDATYNHRKSIIQSPSTATADYLANGVASVPKVDAFSVSPKLSWQVSGNWTLNASGTYGQSKTFVQSKLYSAGSAVLTVDVNYRDTLKTGEIGFEGRVLALPAGDLRLAGGTGYRSNSLKVLNTFTFDTATTVTSDFTSSRDSYFVYGEARVPIVSPRMAVSGVYRLELDGALRYEDYLHVDRLATPKLGILYAPIEGVSLKGSWGQSFKAPTLYQQFQAKFVSLRDVSAYGATGYPAGATALQVSGGNPDSLKPERANTWTATLAIQPIFAPGLSAEVSYFKVRYKGRIIEPIQSRLGLLTNPLYQNLITFNPSAAQIAAAISGAPEGISNQTSGPYDPTKVVAIVDGRERNSARQDIQGVDFNLRYRLQAGTVGQFTVTGNATYLDSSQILVAGLPAYNLAGTIFDPPHWRWRVGVIWEKQTLSASAFVNRVSGVVDDRLTSPTNVAGMTTLDLALAYAIENGALKGFEASFAVQNVTNTKPAIIQNSSSIDPTWDSTNYSAIGRSISFTLSKRF